VKYRLVYDVLDDGFPWFGAAFAAVPLLLAIVHVLEIRERVRGLPRGPAPRVRGTIPLEAVPLPLVIVSFLVLGSAGVLLASLTCEGFVQRQRCREWARGGRCQVTEGTIADYHYRKAGSSFRVGDQSFDLLNPSAGFTGPFNAPGAGKGSLREGLQVRLTHREGFILRVEIACEAAGAAGGADGRRGVLLPHPSAR
jgi:hypothetical protein